MTTAEGFRVLDEKSLREYIKATPSLASKLGTHELDNLDIKEVGDGNLNFVYIIISPSGSLVIKQVFPQLTLPKFIISHLFVTFKLTSVIINQEDHWLLT